MSYLMVVPDQASVRRQMREFVFEILYDETPPPVAELFDAEAVPSAVGVGGCIGVDEFWRIERFSGDGDAIDGLEPSALEDVLAVESLTAVPCEGTVHAEVLERTATQCEVYYHLKGISGCDSVATLAADCLGTDVLFEVTRTGECETWTVMMDSDDGIGLFYDAVQASLRPALRFRFCHIGQASDRRMDLFAKKNLPPEQREALVAAVKHGYYETPRQTTLEELSASLNCPRSTLSYRLRRAESKLAKAFTFDKAAELQGLPWTAEEGDEP